jgi:D-serine deaminase-like pyridoxal phosphate-dependent protein
MQSTLTTSYKSGQEYASSPASLKLKDLPTPAFVINRHAFEKNCRAMLKMAKDRGLSLRPHVKTHKTPQGAWIQVAGTAWSANEHETSGIVTGFVTSTIPEVSMLINAAPQVPFRDILYGVPISESKLASLDKLRRKIPDGHIHIMLDHPTQVAFVENYARNTPDALPFSAFLKLDTGYHRAGITCDERGVKLAIRILESPYLELRGVYSHWYVLLMWVEILVIYYTLITLYSTIADTRMTRTVLQSKRRLPMSTYI